MDLSAPVGADGVFRNERDPRWVQDFTDGVASETIADGLGRLVVHSGSSPHSPVVRRHLPMGVSFEDVGDCHHWAEGAVTRRWVEGVPTQRRCTLLRPEHARTHAHTHTRHNRFCRGRYMRITVIPRLNGAVEAAAALMLAGAGSISMPLKRRWKW